jgi:diguanylate cyclase (GGDEF)-like protein/PAS domain S-box-containing protein
MLTTEFDTTTEYEALIQFLYLAPVGLVQATGDGEIVMINPISAQLLMPLSRDGGLSNLFNALEPVAPELRHLVANFQASHGMVCDALRIHVNAGVQGKTEPQVLSLSLLKLDATRLMAVLSDVTQQVKRERLLKQNEAWLNAILTGITDYAVVSLDGQGHINDWNPSIARVTGYTREAVLGQTYAVFYPDQATTPERVLDRLREADGNGWSLDDGWRKKADGSRFWGSALIAPLHDRAIEGAPGDQLAVDQNERSYCLVLRDITDKQGVSEAHRKATSCDHLTGIANRRAFFEAVELELERCKRAPRPLSLVMLDVDHFKRVNDAHGHPAGDEVLRHLARWLLATFREVDVVARFGGEEFAVLLPSAGIEAAAAAAERFRQALEAHPVTVDGQLIACTVSAGVASQEDGLLGVDALLKRADQALYAAKAQGRNRVLCWSSP